jgi:hypothetical protein
MHATEGWLLFVVAFAILAALAWLLSRLERAVLRHRPPTPPASATPAEPLGAEAAV